MNSIGNIFALLQKGAAVANKAAWTSGQVTASVLGGLIIGAVNILQANGYPVPIDAATANEIGGAIIAVANTVITVITNEHIGIGSAK